MTREEYDTYMAIGPSKLPLDVLKRVIAYGEKHVCPPSDTCYLSWEEYKVMRQNGHIDFEAENFYADLIEHEEFAPFEELSHMLNNLDAPEYADIMAEGDARVTASIVEEDIQQPGMQFIDRLRDWVLEEFANQPSSAPTR
jgi:hypothetical protein